MRSLPKWYRKTVKRPLTIGIGGAESGTGKTTVAAALLKHLTGPSGQQTGDLHPASRESGGHPFGQGRWGAIKYTATSLYTSIIDDTAVLRRKGKDTGRLLDAGASHVLWVQAPRDDAGEVLSIAAAKLSYLDGIVIEGNSAIEFLRPDIVLFVCGGSTPTAKPSGVRILTQADIVILPEGACSSLLKRRSPGKGAHLPAGRLPVPVTLRRDPREGFTEADARELAGMIGMIAREKEIERLLREKAVEGRISCAAARAIAEDLRVSYREVGRVANELKVKIRECELGCF